MAEITQQQFDALAELMRLRTGSKAREAARLVLVDGVSIGDAGRAVELPYKDASRAVQAAHKALNLARIASQ